MRRRQRPDRPARADHVGGEDLRRLHRLLLTHGPEVLGDGTCGAARVGGSTSAIRLRAAIAAVCLAVLISAGLSDTDRLQPGLRGHEPAISLGAQRLEDGIRLDWAEVEGATHYVLQVWRDDGLGVEERIVDAGETEAFVAADEMRALICLVEAWDGPDWLSRSSIVRVSKQP